MGRILFQSTHQSRHHNGCDHSANILCGGTWLASSLPFALVYLHQTFQATIQKAKAIKEGISVKAKSQELFRVLCYDIHMLSFSGFVLVSFSNDEVTIIPLHVMTVDRYFGVSVVVVHITVSVRRTSVLPSHVAMVSHSVTSK